MNRDQITAWAREATDEPCPYDNGSVTWSFTKPELERFAALVAAAEREACARVCEETNSASFRETGCPAEGGECAAVIRARGEGLVRKTHQFSNKTIRARGEE